MQNILLHVSVSELVNEAVEHFLEENYSEQNVLIYEMLEDCRFNPKVRSENIYTTDNMRRHLFRDIKGYYESEPIGVDLLRKMSLYEGEIYKMMDTYFPPLSTFDERQRIYFNAVRLFNHIIKKNHINQFIIFGVPHQIYDFIIYALCKCNNIKTSLIYHMPVRGYIYYFHDLQAHGINLKNYENCRLDSLSQDFKEKVQLYMDFHKDVKPYYMRNKTISDKIVLLKSRIKQFFTYTDIKNNLLKLVKLFVRKKKIDKYIRSLSSSVDYSKKYIYVGLHYQPEGTTSPMGGIFVNQQLIIQLLSYSVPKDIFIYVKEHPNQYIRGEKNIDFFKEISELRNVVIVPTETSTYELERHCLAVATCTGTLAYESLYKKKPSLLFGNSLYNYMPGAFTIQNVEECIAAISEIRAGICINEQMIIDYVYNLYKISYHAEFSIGEKDYILSQKITMKENNIEIKRLLNDIIKA